MHVNPDIKTGDPVYLKRSYAAVADATLETVERVTPKQVIVNGQRFWKSNGWQVGKAFKMARIWSPIVNHERPSWWDVYCVAFEKCQRSRDQGRYYIEVQQRTGEYKLLAHLEYRGFMCIQMPGGGVAQWASQVADAVARYGLCDNPRETDEIYRR
jgi:hypothetical protein